MFLSTLIGVVAGGSAILFTSAIDFVTHLSLERFAAYLPPSPVGEGTTEVMAIGKPMLLPLITAFGGLVSGLIVFGLAPEAEGYKTPAEGFGLDSGEPRKRTSASCLSGRCKYLIIIPSGEFACT